MNRLLFENTKEITKDRIHKIDGQSVILWSVSFCFLQTCAVGSILERYGYLNLHEWWKCVIAVCLTSLLSFVLHCVFEWIENHQLYNRKCCTVSKKELLSWSIFLFVAWGIVLLGVYPGFFVYDAGDELNQVITCQFSTHHPLLHVLYLGEIIQAGYHIFGNYNAGIFCFFLIQMSIFIISVMYVFYKMYSFGFHRYVCRGMIIFMGFFPVIPMFVLCSCKDSIFSLIFLLLIVTTYEWWNQPGKWCRCRWIVWAVLMCLLRNNAIYALVIAGFFLVLFMKPYRKQLVVMLVGVIGSTILISYMLAGSLHAKTGGKQELLTVPIQQLARTYQLDRTVFTVEEEELLLSYLPEKYVARYTPKLSDGVKVGFQNEPYQQNSRDFWKLWLRIGLKAPLSYLNAWMMTSYGFWYPDASVDVYRGNVVYTFTYGDSSYFGYETEQPGVRESKISWIDEFYRKLSLEVWKEKIPVIAQVFSMGCMFWVYIGIMTFLILRRGIKSVMPYSLIFWMIATLMLGPTYLPRYVFFLWLVIPFMLGDAFVKES